MSDKIDIVWQWELGQDGWWLQRESDERFAIMTPTGRHPFTVLMPLDEALEVGRRFLAYHIEYPHDLREV